jgi:predicted DCC family thiol-disulfide oxidoreductase YuxK
VSVGPDIEVFYDGGCPICRWEIRLYGRMDKAQHIRWTDIEVLKADQLPPGKSREDLLGRFHVRDLNDQKTTHQQDWHIGVDAFARIWAVLPGLRYFAGLFRVPGLRQIAFLGYRLFLRWQRWHRTHRTRRGNFQP